MSAIRTPGVTGAWSSTSGVAPERGSSYSGITTEDRDALREAGFTTQCTLALCATDPPLALSHVPLWSVPHGTINVHGHIHGGHEPTPAHINITIERLQYTPIGMTWLVADARRRRWITGG